MVIIGQRVFPRTEFDRVLGHRLHLARWDCGMTQAEAARELGVTRETVGRWELGVRRPGLVTLRRAARLYRVSSEVLLGWGCDLGKCNDDCATQFERGTGSHNLE